MVLINLAIEFFDSSNLARHFWEASREAYRKASVLQKSVVVESRGDQCEVVTWLVGDLQFSSVAQLQANAVMSGTVVATDQHDVEALLTETFHSVSSRLAPVPERSGLPPAFRDFAYQLLLISPILLGYFLVLERLAPTWIALPFLLIGLLSAFMGPGYFQRRAIRTVLTQGDSDGSIRKVLADRGLRLPD